MSRAFKITLITLGTVVVLLIALVVGIINFVNPNDFKPLITKEVQSRTSRTLSMDGDISWRIFPWLGLKMEGLRLSNPVEFGSEPMAKIDEADFQVKLLPLFYGQFQVGNIVIKKMDLVLIKNAKGVTNWDDLKKAAQKTEPNAKKQVVIAGPEQSSIRLLALTISGIELEDSHVSWKDQTNNTQMNITKLNFNGHDIGINHEFPIKLKFDLASNKPNVEGSIDFSTQIEAQPTKNLYQLHNLDFAAKLKDSTKIQLKTTVMVNAKTGELAKNKYELSAGDMTITGELEGSNVLDNPTIQGTFNADTFNLKSLLNELANKPINTKDANALTKVNFKGRFLVNNDSLQGVQLHAQVDASQINGEFTYNFNGKPLNFNLKMDTIAVDHYLPSDNSSAKTKTALQDIDLNIIKTATAAETKTSAKDGLNMMGNIAINNLSFNDLQLSNLTVGVKGNNNIYNFAPIQANLYQGKYYGTIAVDMRNTQPVVTMNNVLQGVNADVFLKDLGVTKLKVTGTADINSQLKMHGSDSQTILKSLQGNTLYVFKNGTLHGINLFYFIDLARSVLEGKPKPTDTNIKETPFGALTGNIVFNNGIATNNDMKLTGSQIHADGHGTANLISEQLDFHINASYSGPGLDATIPISITGSFDNPTVRPDVSGLAKIQIKKELLKHSDKIQNKVNDFLNKNLGNGKKLNLNQLFN